MDEPGAAARGRATLKRSLLLAGLAFVAACGDDSPRLPDPQSTEGYLFVSSDTTLGGFAISDTGALTPLPGSPLALGPAVSRRSLGTDAGQRFVILSEDVDGSRARVYQVDRASGAFREVAGSPFFAGAGGVSHLRFGTELGIAASDGANMAQPLRLDAATGAITPFGPATSLQSQFSDFTLDPSGRLAFELTFNDVNSYVVESNGPLRRVSTLRGDPGTSLDDMSRIAVTSSGRWMVGASGQGQFMHLLSLDAAGVLQRRDRMSPGRANGPAFAVDQRERFVFAATADNAGAVLASLRLDQAAGRLLPVGMSRLQIGGGSVAVTPSGRFVYHLTTLTPIVSGFRIDEATGALTPVPGSPYGAPAGSRMVAIR